MTDRLASTEAALAILDAGSVAAGARRLGLTPSAASRLLARLEARLGVVLARRTTRSLTPTPEGLAFATAARAALDQLAQADAAAVGARSSLSGVLRVNAMLPYAVHRLIPRLGAFRTVHPELELDLTLTDHIVDLVSERVDVAVRSGPLRPAAGLRARRIERSRELIVASPDYLERRGVPRHPSELRRHERLDLALTRARTAWPFRVAGRRLLVPTEATIRSDSGEGLRAMALAGLGLARLSAFEVERDMARGGLVEVLGTFHAGGHQLIHAVYALHDSAGPSARVRAFIDFLCAISSTG